MASSPARHGEAAVAPMSGAGCKDELPLLKLCRCFQFELPSSRAGIWHLVWLFLLCYCTHVVCFQTRVHSSQSTCSAHVDCLSCLVCLLHVALVLGSSSDTEPQCSVPDPPRNRHLATVLLLVLCSKICILPNIIHADPEIQSTIEIEVLELRCHTLQTDLYYCWPPCGLSLHWPC